MGLPWSTFRAVLPGMDVLSAALELPFLVDVGLADDGRAAATFPAQDPNNNTLQSSDSSLFQASKERAVVDRCPELLLPIRPTVLGSGLVVISPRAWRPEG